LEIQAQFLALATNAQVALRRVFDPLPDVSAQIAAYICLPRVFLGMHLAPLTLLEGSQNAPFPHQKGDAIPAGHRHSTLIREAVQMVEYVDSAEELGSNLEAVMASTATKIERYLLRNCCPFVKIEPSR
jgi:hypothetical protein